MSTETLKLLNRKVEKVDHLIQTIFILNGHYFDLDFHDIARLLDTIKSENEQMKTLIENELEGDEK